MYLMPTSYFSKFPTTIYDIDNTGTNVRFITDIIHRAKFLEIVRKNIIVFYPYHIKEGETPDIIAEKLYGSSMYYWVVMFANNIFDIWNDWPLSYDQFIAYLNKKYGSVQVAQSTIDHYEDNLGVWIDLATYNATFAQGSIKVYSYDYETTLNEEKKNIQLVDPQYITIIENELDALMVPPSQ